MLLSDYQHGRCGYTTATEYGKSTHEMGSPQPAVVGNLQGFLWHVYHLSLEHTRWSFKWNTYNARWISLHSNTLINNENLERQSVPSDGVEITVNVEGDSLTATFKCMLEYCLFDITTHALS